MDFVKETERLMIRPFNLSYLEEYSREFTAEITKYQFPDPFPDMEAANRVMSGFVEEMKEGKMLVNYDGSESDYFDFLNE